MASATDFGNALLQVAHQWSSGCIALYSPVPSIYGYQPSLPAGIVFVALFTISTVAHFTQTIRSRRWWTLIFGIGAVIELLGWCARIWSNRCPYNVAAYLLQLCCLIIAPTFLTGGAYWLLGILIRHFGPHTSPISSYKYLWIFGGCDALSLILQATGIGIASRAIDQFPPLSSAKGTNIMVAGIVFQLASILVFGLLFAIFVRRARGSDMYTGRVKSTVICTTFVVSLILVRGVYRSVELAQGLTGFLMNHEGYFIGLDSSLMAVAFLAYNFCHPAWLVEPKTDIEKASTSSSPTVTEIQSPGAFDFEFEDENHNEPDLKFEMTKFEDYDMPEVEFDKFDVASHDKPNRESNEAEFDSYNASVLDFEKADLSKADLGTAQFGTFRKASYGTANAKKAGTEKADLEVHKELDFHPEVAEMHKDEEAQAGSSRLSSPKRYSWFF